ncbi:MAG: ERMES complex subunit [Caeruleum heppii]|nr:MAG: ERMES complex subunit [Caeruleum heppii]
MAFNFNWSPLTADATFYSRARELLTTALNKSPKPPIIVDDILVSELNLGSVPPELEILEIGDLAEDRFRGIFKMCYSGDAFLTLQTRVQIRLSAFIILVFSRQKGLTLVFRNDPLESLKVSSTFDSIPFVRDYLQKEIEGQLRLLLMEDVPAIIHRLSLQLWVPEYQMEIRDPSSIETNAPEEKAIDPFANPPQDAIDARGNRVDTSGLASFPPDLNGSDHRLLFSQKNLLRLAALTDCQRTLSLFTPTIGDAVFRAWAGPSERGEARRMNTPNTVTPRSLSRTGSVVGPLSDATGVMSLSSRPSLVSVASASSGLGSGYPRNSRIHAGKKRRTRVINLRRTQSHDGLHIETELSRPSTPVTATSAEGVMPLGSLEEKVEEPVTPPQTPASTVRFSHSPGSIDLGTSPPRRRPVTPSRNEGSSRLVNQGAQTSPEPAPALETTFSTRPAFHNPRPSLSLAHLQSFQLDRSRTRPASLASSSSLNLAYPAHGLENPNGGILERAWMLKIAGEIVRKAEDERSPSEGIWRRPEGDEAPPPAYRL